MTQWDNNYPGRPPTEEPEEELELRTWTGQLIYRRGPHPQASGTRAPAEPYLAHRYLGPASPSPLAPGLAGHGVPWPRGRVRGHVAGPGHPGLRSCLTPAQDVCKVRHMMNQSLRCETGFTHCTACGSYSIKDVAHDLGYLNMSRCCAAPVSLTECNESHPPYIPTNPTVTKRAAAASLKRGRAVQAKKKATEPTPATGARSTGTHANCSHPTTPAARRKCRAERNAS